MAERIEYDGAVRAPSRDAASQSFRSIILLLAAALCLMLPLSTYAAAPPPEQHPRDWTGLSAEADSRFAAGAAIYKQACAACHDTGVERAPQRRALQDLTPATIRRALSDGVMREQGSALSDAQRIQVAEYLAGRAFVPPSDAALRRCDATHASFDLNEPPAFSGWGLDAANSHAVPANATAITRSNVGSLRLKWAFGFPDANRARSQPAIAAGAIFVGSHNGGVYALDRATGCLRWRFEADAEVRTGIVVAPWRAGDTKARPRLYFGDVSGNAYAIDLLAGTLVWKVVADSHPSATLTAAPTLHDGTLFVPVSSIEEAAAAAPNYACCSFRGSVLALDAATGKQIWRTWLGPAATVRATNAQGIERLGPAGAAVWNSPAIDARRGQLTVASSDNYSAPATELSDAIIAMDLKTGRIRWHYQALAGDMWNVACFSKTSDACPNPQGPDYGFGAATVLARTRDGRELVIAGQKSGWAFAVDPDDGKLVWRQRVGRGGVGAGIYFGMAAVDGRLFVPVTDRADGQPHDHPASPGLHALDLGDGSFAWRALAPDTCAGRAGCDPGFGSAITATPELVAAGADDGHLRIYGTADGKLLLDIDTVRDFPTVNAVAARGGAIGGGAAPIFHGRNLIVSSGYGYASKLPGNVLLVYEAAD
ncbi:PQQ-binding-like beta-propeller repeat protein [Novosphingobium sp. JCM 18896]|uniref:outer membrane protein assembly factor BamB family protein n=1 Tax=Novosphingobium sp. JCM 18896 TaxID=2989731 RepID=UPI002221C3B6|nr:PQQ-binding-like beta-propeller repeat protein [Novosphingobium sp. JCM 18896]MCW1429850.1 PQQ-binding-like beta-propeller repeat protein [Novosphingobium sp. JCM 18896]